jgi:hypothetical protein
MENEFSLRLFIGLFAADVDIFLLQNKEQTADNDKEFFTRDEIRSQLETTVSKFANVMQHLGYNIDKPLLK